MRLPLLSLKIHLFTMKQLKKPLLNLVALLLLAFAFSSEASGKFLPGYVVLNDGTKLTGLVEYRNWKKNPKTIEFKQTAEVKASEYSVNDISSFEVNGHVRYIKATVVIDERPVDPLNVDPFQDDTFVTEAVFLRVVVAGHPLSLYSYFDLKPHYFYSSDSSATIEELIYRLSWGSRKRQYSGNDAMERLVHENAATGTSNNFVVTEYGFRNQLQNALPFALNAELTDLLNNMEYFEGALKRFVLKVDRQTEYSSK